MKKPIIGITMGDPASIGPEISVKALTDPKVLDMCDPLIIGDAAVMEDAVKVVCPGQVKVRAVKNVGEAVFEPGVINVYDMGLVDMDRLEYGKVSAMCGEAAFRYVEKVIALAMDGEIDATVTNALNKAAINLAGHHFAGHTEIYAHFTGTKNYTMMLAHENLRVVHVSTHVSLREACDRVKKERVLTCIKIADEACRALGTQARHRIAARGRGRAQPPLGRGRSVRTRGDRRDRARHRTGPRPRHQRRRPRAARHGLFQGARRLV